MSNLFFLFSKNSCWFYSKIFIYCQKLNQTNYILVPKFVGQKNWLEYLESYIVILLTINKVWHHTFNDFYLSSLIPLIIN